MSHRRVFDFLGDLGRDPRRLDELRTLPREEVLARAHALGYGFTTEQFEDAVWGFEIFLAGKRGEAFDFHFSLWESMWGLHYLDFLVHEVVGPADPADVDAFLDTL